MHASSDQSYRFSTTGNAKDMPRTERNFTGLNAPLLNYQELWEQRGFATCIQMGGFAICLSRSLFTTARRTAGKPVHDGHDHGRVEYPILVTPRLERTTGNDLHTVGEFLSDRKQVGFSPAPSPEVNHEAGEVHTGSRPRFEIERECNGQEIPVYELQFSPDMSAATVLEDFVADL